MGFATKGPRMKFPSREDGKTIRWCTQIWLSNCMCACACVCAEGGVQYPPGTQEALCCSISIGPDVSLDGVGAYTSALADR